MEIKTNEDFIVKVVDNERPVLVDFYATWCQPCKRIAPLVEEAGKKLDGVVDVYKIDVDSIPHLVTELGIASVPTLFLFENGSISNRVPTAFTNADQLVNVVRELLDYE